MLLLVYAEVTSREKPAKQIDLLSILVEIAEKVLRRSFSYRKTISLDYDNIEEATATNSVMIRYLDNAMKKMLEQGVNVQKEVNCPS